MPSYQSPGVYVEEVPSGIKPIAGVGTSTAGFVGVLPSQVQVTAELVSKVHTSGSAITSITVPNDLPIAATPTGFATPQYNIQQVWVPNKSGVMIPVPRDPDHGWSIDDPLTAVTLKSPYDTAKKVRVDFLLTYTFALTDPLSPLPEGLVLDKKLATWVHSSTTLTTWDGKVTKSPTITSGLEIAAPESLKGIKDPVFSVSGVTQQDGKISIPKAAFSNDFTLYVSYAVFQDYTPVAKNTPVLCTGFGDFKRSFGDVSGSAEQSRLAHAVHGFFNNGGSRCFVVQAASNGKSDVESALAKLGLIDEIAIVAAPGVAATAGSETPLSSPQLTAYKAVCDALTSHCVNLGDRFAVFDCPEVVETNQKLDLTLLSPDTPPATRLLPQGTDRGAYYFPWIQVFDPPTKKRDPGGNGLLTVPPSGHVAGIYARVDTQRGVYKAPANEAVRGALGLKYTLSKADQAGLNPNGINAIRSLNNQTLVWGARTLSGDAEWKYINVRRLFLFLEESIDEGTQWAVFEPNDPSLWAKISRNITAFLTNVWRDGALFGATPQEAFYVKCDAETNPPEVREAGRVVAEVGVAPVKPAEFVVFRVSQWAGAGQ